MIRKLILIYTLLSLCLCSITTKAVQPIPASTDAQRALNLALRMQDYRMDGIMKVSGKTQASYPIMIVTADWITIYTFPTKNLKILALLGPDKKCVQVLEKDKPVQVLSPSQYKQAILNSDISYEDLCLDFTQWKISSPITEDSILTLPAWSFVVSAPPTSNYSSVRLWMSSVFYGLLRIDALNAQNQVIKRVQVDNVAKIEDTYLLKELVVSSMSGGRDISTSKTFINIDHYQKIK